MEGIILFIYDIFSYWFKPKSLNDTLWNRIIKGSIGALLIILSISILIFCIYLIANLKNAA